MAQRGGYQRPTNPSSVSGVGKNSKRTDGRQAIRSPNVQDSTDLTQGDRERIRQGQRIAPLSRTPAPRVQAPAPGPPPMAGAGGGPAQLPPELLSMPSYRPGEPVTEGLDYGAGGGSERLTPPPPQTEMEEILAGVIAVSGDKASFDMLSDWNEFKAWRAERTAPAPVPEASAVSESVPPQDFEPEISQEFDIATEEGAVETPLESPAPPPPTEGGGDEPVVLPPQAGGNPEMV